MPKNSIYILCLCIFPLIIYSQTNSKEKFNFEDANKSVQQHLFSKPDSAKYYLELMVKNSTTSKIPDTSLAKIYNNYGLYFSMISRFDSAKVYFKKAIQKSETRPRNKAGSLMNLANVLRNESDYESSLKYLEAALKIYESIDDKIGMGMTYGEMGSNYAYMLDNTKSINKFMKGIKLLEKSPEKQKLTVVKQKLANLYFKMKNYDFAIEIYEECLINMKESNDLKNYYLTLINYGDCLIMVKKYAEAKVALIEAIEGIEPFQSPELTALAHNKLSKAYLFTDNEDLALNHGKTAFDNIKLTQSFRISMVSTDYINILNTNEDYNKSLEVINYVRNLPTSIQSKFNIEDQMHFEYASSKTYVKTDFKDLAIEALEKVVSLNQTITNANKELEIQEVQAKFQTKTQQEKNNALQEKNKLLDEKIKAQNKNYIFMGIIIFVLTIVIIAFGSISSLRNKLQLSKLKEAQIEKERILKTREEELKEKEKQEQILSLRNQELTSVALQLADLQEQIVTIINNPELQKIQNIKSELQKLIKQEDYWKKFYLKFSQIHPDFENNIKTQFPVLTRNDMDFICLLKLKLSNKEIATLLQISHESVISKKYRIKKKMNIDDEDDFNEIISSL